MPLSSPAIRVLPANRQQVSPASDAKNASAWPAVRHRPQICTALKGGHCCRTRPEAPKGGSNSPVGLTSDAVPELQAVVTGTGSSPPIVQRQCDPHQLFFMALPILIALSSLAEAQPWLLTRHGQRLVLLYSPPDPVPLHCLCSPDPAAVAHSGGPSVGRPLTLKTWTGWGLWLLSIFQSSTR